LRQWPLLVSSRPCAVVSFTTEWQCIHHDDDFHHLEHIEGRTAFVDAIDIPKDGLMDAMDDNKLRCGSKLEPVAVRW